MGDCPFRQPSSSTPQATQLNQTIFAEINSRFWLLQAAIVGTFALFNFSGIGAGDVPSAAIGWPLAVLSAVAGVMLFYCVLRPPIPTVAQTLVSFFVTAIAGVIALLAFQEIAAAATNTSKGPPLFWIVRLIGHAYQMNQSFLNKPENDIPFVVGVLATIFSNGLCEEFVKLAPAAYLIATKNDLQYRDALFIGAVSGLGFGVAEGVHYANNIYGPGGAAMSEYLLRFSGVAWSHGIYSIISTATAFAWRDALRKATKSKSAGWEVAVMLALCSLVSAIPHAFYNSFIQIHVLLSIGVDFATVSIAMLLAYPELATGEQNVAESRQVHGEASDDLIIAEVVEPPQKLSVESRAFDVRGSIDARSHYYAMPWLLGCGVAVGLAGLLIFASILSGVRGTRGVGHAQIRVKWRDGTPELQAMAGELTDAERVILGLGIMATGIDVYGARVRIENTGGVPVQVFPDNVVIHLGAQSTTVTSATDVRFLRRTTLQPGQFTEGLVMFRAAPDSGAAVRLGAGSLSYQDASIEVVY